MDGKLFLGTARFLRNSGSDEAAYRSAVSRAYYACFLAAREVAFNNCDINARNRAAIRNEKGISHEYLQRYLKGSSEDSIRKIGESLSGMHGSRKDADYAMSCTITDKDAQDAIDNADIFLQDLSGIRPSMIGQAMQNYIELVYKK